MAINADLMRQMAEDEPLRKRAFQLFLEMCRYRYSYNFTWMGRPIIQFPEDMVAMQEIVWRIRPEIIVETGIAHGGSLVFWASLLELLGGDRRVIGIDIEIRPHNRLEIARHPLSRRITTIEGSSIDPSIVEQLRSLVKGRSPVMVVLDSNHTHAHVLEELRQYSPLVGRGSYLIVCDTVVEEMPDGSFPDRPWGRGNNPATAVRQFLEENGRFRVDQETEGKLLFTVAPGGYLECTRD